MNAFPVMIAMPTQHVRIPLAVTPANVAGYFLDMAKTVQVSFLLNEGQLVSSSTARRDNFK